MFIFTYKMHQKLIFKKHLFTFLDVNFSTKG